MPFKSKSQERYMFAKHPKIAKEFEEETPANAKLPEHVKSMASGGLALNDDENKKLSDFLTPQSPTPPLTPGEDIGSENDDSKTVDSNPGHSPQDLEGYIASQTAQIDKYGPEQEKAVMDSIVKGRGSLGRGVSHAGATFADALMQGVAGAGNPGFAKNLDENQARVDEMRLKEPQVEQAMNAQNMGAKEKLAGMTSSSPLGASMTAPLAAFFKRVGVPESEIPKMLANPAAARGVVEPFAAVMTAEDKMKMETMLRQLELGQRDEQIRGTLANQEAQTALDKSKQEQDALKTISNQGPLDSILHNRWTSEGKALREKAGLDKPEEPSHGIPDLGETFNGHKVIGVKRIK